MLSFYTKQRGPHLVWFLSSQLPLLFPARNAEFISLVSFRLGCDNERETILQHTNLQTRFMPIFSMQTNKSVLQLNFENSSSIMLNVQCDICLMVLCHLSGPTFPSLRFSKQLFFSYTYLSSE